MQNKKEHRTEKLQMITQWQQSGLSQMAFCTANNIAYHVFHYWYGVYRANQNTTSSFVPVNITPGISHDQLTLISLNGIQLKLAFTDQAVRFIKQLLLP